MRAVTVVFGVLMFLTGCQPPVPPPTTPPDEFPVDPYTDPQVCASRPDPFR
jgi:hypothetical protein